MKTHFLYYLLVQCGKCKAYGEAHGYDIILRHEPDCEIQETLHLRTVE